jgi:hypothetical protein
MCKTKTKDDGSTLANDADSRIDDIPKQLHAEYRLQHGTHRRREHVRDGRGDLDGEDAGDADEETDDALGEGQRW